MSFGQEMVKLLALGATPQEFGDLQKTQMVKFRVFATLSHHLRKDSTYGSELWAALTTIQIDYLGR
jgi:hypothetical protein